MSILCWNVWGLGNPRAFQALKRALKKPSPNLVFLSETKLHKGEVDRFRHLLGFEEVLQVESEGNSGGLLLLWREWDVVVQSFSKGHIDVKVRMDNGMVWHFTGFYGNPNQSNRSFSWELLKRIRWVDKLPWIC
ncbi:hypothetical protein Dsin_015693 [Dipteronia sinensis]|uniref:Endonuclease/exonuclease/phosphatase domain-containing protein n=1 Tax=Dipteronia sinensis TaxID=43782 RepID=A0AAE0ACX0_9ROSI|nr:hypothetical protein Dsin_015693 [Dipteronia sinensis]